MPRRFPFSVPGYLIRTFASQFVDVKTGQTKNQTSFMWYVNVSMLATLRIAEIHEL